MIAAYSSIERDVDRLANYLAPTERARLEGLGPRRRREYLVSRALTKYLFLNRDDVCVVSSADVTTRATTARDLPLTSASLREIALAQLENVPPRHYREVEIHRASRDVAPVLYWRGVEQTETRLSIAHADGYCVAALCERRIGVDIATVERRVPAFYRRQFSEHERQWAADDDALYTLLWTVKESLVKAGLAVDLSLWGFDEIDVRIDAPAHDIATMYDGLRDGAIIALTGRASIANGETQHTIAFSRIANSLFSFVTLESAAA